MWLLLRLLIAVANPPFCPLSFHLTLLLLYHSAFWLCTKLLQGANPPHNSHDPSPIIHHSDRRQHNTCQSWSGISSCLVMIVGVLIWGCAQSGSQTGTTVKRIVCCSQRAVFFPHWESFPILKVCIITAGSRGATWMCVVPFFNFVSLLHYRIHRAIKNTGFDPKLTLKHIWILVSQVWITLFAPR